MSSLLEVAVIGGGPAGLKAALAARYAGAAVTLFDAYPRVGGQYYRQQPHSHRAAEGRRLWQQVEAAGVEIRSSSQVWNLSSECVLSVATPEGSETYQAQAVVAASGAYERVVPFPGWTLPGVITTGAAQTLLAQGVKPGRRALIAGTGPLTLVTAADLLRAGVDVVAIAEGSPLGRRSLRHAPAFWGQWERLGEGLRSTMALARRRVRYLTGWGLAAAHGESVVDGATIGRLDTNWRLVPGSERCLACDTVCVNYGLTPFSALVEIAGAQFEWRSDLGGQVPVRDAAFCTTVPGLFAVGDGAGVRGARMAMLEGAVAGIAAAARAGYGKERAAAALARLAPAVSREARFSRAYSELFTPGPGVYELAHDDTLICRCEGTTLGMLRTAVAEGATTLIEAKAVTRCGMGECQGRACGQAISEIMAGFVGRATPDIGFSRARPPIMPLPLSALTPKG
jgi:NADPH-dependent 2,4-dienoyl-CoA reductase/sulfur reductase-like enzyme